MMDHPLRKSVTLASIMRSLASLGITIFIMSCATTSTHQFAEPARDWQTRTGQLLYRTAKTTVIGDVVVRFSTAGNFELTLSKGPGVTLLTIREDSSFAEIKGP